MTNMATVLIPDATREESDGTGFISGESVEGVNWQKIREEFAPYPIAEEPAAGDIERGSHRGMMNYRRNHPSLS